jgi:hypothetical protein
MESAVFLQLIQLQVTKFKKHSKLLLKIGTANAICWNYLGLFRDYGLDHIFFVFQDSKLKFSVPV